MTMPRPESNDDVTEIRKPERIVCDGRKIAAASSAAPNFGNRFNVPPGLDVTLQEVAAKISRAVSKDTSDAIEDKTVSEKHPALRSQATKSISSARLEDIVQKQITSMPVLVENTVLQFFGDEEHDTESRLDTKVFSVIRTVVNRDVLNAYQSSTF